MWCARTLDYVAVIEMAINVNKTQYSLTEKVSLHFTSSLFVSFASRSLLVSVELTHIHTHTAHVSNG